MLLKVDNKYPAIN